MQSGQLSANVVLLEQSVHYTITALQPGEFNIVRRCCGSAEQIAPHELVCSAGHVQLNGAAAELAVYLLDWGVEWDLQFVYEHNSISNSRMLRGRAYLRAYWWDSIAVLSSNDQEAHSALLVRFPCSRHRELNTSGQLLLSWRMNHVMKTTDVEAQSHWRQMIVHAHRGGIRSVHLMLLHRPTDFCVVDPGIDSAYLCMTRPMIASDQTNSTLQFRKDLRPGKWAIDRRFSPVLDFLTREGFTWTLTFDVCFVGPESTPRLTDFAYLTAMLPIPEME